VEKDSIKDKNISLFKITDNKTVEEKISELKDNPDIEYIQPNFLYTPQTSWEDLNDTYKDKLWGLNNTGQNFYSSYYGTPDVDMDIPEAWAINEGTNASSSIIVAVIDNGADYTHPDLIANMWDGTNCKDDSGNFLGGCVTGYDFYENDKTPLPTMGDEIPMHGTHIAGTIGAVKNNDIGIMGIAPNVKIINIRTDYSDFQIIRGINFAIQNGAKIINASWGMQWGSSLYVDPAMYNAIASFPGIFVAAAGNNNTSDPFSPAAYDLPNIISVTGVRWDNIKKSDANFGSWVDVAAPGSLIYSTQYNGTYGSGLYSMLNGTSVAASSASGFGGFNNGI
jgi:subtilisin family serine protease